jgi:hypothetical protein
LATEISTARQQFAAEQARKQAALQREHEAQEAAEQARRDRLASEKALPALERDVELSEEQILAGARGQLAHAAHFLERAEAIAKAAQARPSGEARSIARSFLHAPGPEPGRTLMMLASADPVCGHAHEVVRLTSQVGERLAEQGVGDDELDARLDDLNCRGWRLFVQRARWVAGETE